MIDLRGTIINEISAQQRLNEASKIKSNLDNAEKAYSSRVRMLKLCWGFFAFWFVFVSWWATDTWGIAFLILLTSNIVLALSIAIASERKKVYRSKFQEVVDNEIQQR